MSIESAPSAIAPMAGVDLSTSPFVRLQDRIDLPARPLGPKVAALQLRRRRAQLGSLASKSGNRTARAVSLVSKDGTVMFAIGAAPDGLLVQRTQCEALGAHLVQCLVFVDLAPFTRWCNSEPVRFSDPVLFARLRREGDEALGGKR
jgi:hypothetical protein